MTPEDLKTIQTRITTAQNAEARVRRLDDAIGRISGNEIDRVAVSLIGNETAIDYRELGSDRYLPICWAKSEEGIIAELRTAVIQILARRRDEAQAAYDNA